MNISTLDLPGFDPLQFLCKLGKDGFEPAFFMSGEFTILAWNPEDRITWRKKPDWGELKAVLNLRKKKNITKKLPFAGGLIGYMSYDLGFSLHGIKSALPDEQRAPLASFGIYNRALLWNGKNLIVIGDDKFRHEIIEVNSRILPNAPIYPVLLHPQINCSEYLRNFKKIKRAIYDGEIYQMNYTYQFQADCRSDCRQIFSLLARDYPAPRSFYLETPEVKILSLSPESFISLRGNVLSTSPIKGTMPRGRTPSEDARNLKELIESDKELAELNMITDLLRNDLGRVSKPGTVKVISNRLVQKLPSVWHTFSKIEAQLSRQKNVADIFKFMLPGGSVTGCPKARAMEMIDEVEKTKRGPYTGTAVMFSDNGFMDSSIIIRTAVVSRKKIWVGVGGGIVDESSAENELNETTHKAAPFLSLGRVADYWIDGNSVSQRSLFPGIFEPSNPSVSGVFETLRADGGKIQFLKEHVFRLIKSSVIAGFPVGAKSDAIKSLLKTAAQSASWQAARLKIVWDGKHFFIRVTELVLDRFELAGSRVVCVPFERRLPAAKALPYHGEFMAHQEALKRGFHEALLLNRNGMITEGAYSNIFWVENGKLYTPDEKILPGITRSKVIESAKKMKIEICFDLPTLSRLKQADEIFLTRSTAGIVPVVQIENRKVGHGKSAPVTLNLKQVYENKLIIDNG